MKFKMIPRLIPNVVFVIGHLIDNGDFNFSETAGDFLKIPTGGLEIEKGLSKWNNSWNQELTALKTMQRVEPL